MAFIRFVDSINKVIEVIVGILLLMMTLSIFLQVLVRFVFTNFSAPWTEELSRYLMIWAIFLGAAIIARRADSLAVEALVTAVPKSAGRVIKVIAHLSAIAFYVYIFFVGLDMAKFGMSETSAAMKLPMIYIYSAMSVGAVLTIVSSIALLLDIYLNKKDILEVIDLEVEEALAEYKKDDKGGMPA
jgi:TRAP-type C4-dicarboxylate transport system permease small subunit